MAATESFAGIAISARLQILRVGSAVYIYVKFSAEFALSWKLLTLQVEMLL